MVRLSIVVPALANIEKLEASLVSILANRPPRSEVLVVLSTPYADPYGLAEEVQFVEAPPGAGWIESVNRGMEACAAPIVNILTPGVEVPEGWTAAVLRHFENPQVASVAPLVLDAAQRTRAIALGVQYRASGRRCLVGVGLSESAIADTGAKSLGPISLAGFYRKSAVELVGGFDPSVGDQLCDVDLAVRLGYAGYACVCEPLSRIWASMDGNARASGVRQAQESERLFWRNFTARGNALSVLSHAALVGQEFVRNLPRLSAPGALVGRLAAALELGRYVRHRHQLRQIRQQAAAALGSEHIEERRYLRIDSAQPIRPHGTRPTSRPVARRMAA